MKIIRTVVILDKGGIIDSTEWETIHSTYTKAIHAIVHPPGNKVFTLRQKTKKLNKKRQGILSMESKWRHPDQAAISRQARRSQMEAGGAVEYFGFEGKI
jgi:hypothetical protein